MNPDEPPIGGPKLGITALCMALVFMAAIDMSIVVLALPQLRAALGASIEDTSWFVNAYLVANLTMIPMTGFLQRRYGFRVSLSVAVAVFGLASLSCSLCATSTQLVLARGLQGLGGGVMMPSAMALLIQRFDEHERPMAIAWTSVGVLAGSLSGTSVGGWLVDRFGWEMIFSINLPISALLLVGLWGFIRRDLQDPDPPAFDALSYLLLAGMMIALHLAFEEWIDWGGLRSPKIGACLLVSLGGALALYRRERDKARPTLNVRLLRRKSFALAVLLSFGRGVIVFGAIYLSSLMMVEGMGLSPTQSGVVLAQAALCQGLVLFALGRRVRGRSPYRFLALGVLLSASGTWLLCSLTGAESTWQVTWPHFIRVTGVALLSIPLHTLALDGLSDHEVGDANGLYNFFFEFGGAAGNALLALRFAADSALARSQLRSLTPLGGSNWTQIQLAQLAEAVDTHARFVGFNQGFATLTQVSLAIGVGTFFLWLLQREPKGGRSSAH